MQNPTLQALAVLDDEPDNTLQASFKAGIAPEDVESVWLLKRAQPLLAGFTALFHGGFNGVLLRLLVLRELAAETETTALSRNDINTRLAYLLPDSLETVLARLRSHDLLAWDASQSVYRVTPMARNILAALEGLLRTAGTDDEADVGFLLSQVAGAQVIGGVNADQLHQLLGRLVELKEEFSDAIASGSEFRLRQAQAKWHTSDPRADQATHRAAQAIGRAQGALLNMQGMFSRALNQIERQRVHLGQSGLSTTDIKTWLMRQDDLAALADGALAFPVKPAFITPHEMLDVAETELLSDQKAAEDWTLPDGQEVSVTQSDSAAIPRELAQWLKQLESLSVKAEPAQPIAQVLLPAGFAIASYRASLLALLGDPAESQLQGPTAAIARLPLAFQPEDRLLRLNDGEIAAMSAGTLNPLPVNPDPQQA